MNRRLSNRLAEFRRELGHLYGDRLVHAILFGSRARGDADPGSDIDMLVVLNGRVRPSEEIARTSQLRAALCLKHGVVFSCTYLSAHRFRAGQSPLLLNVRREGIAL
ncbi:MAG: nucleotidyltransferase domain-containing protein [Planctomycetes bacterium]|nr:nucleotidyltransferase domain-containing protein [Planctomycetota bacterium]